MISEAWAKDQSDFRQLEQKGVQDERYINCTIKFYNAIYYDLINLIMNNLSALIIAKFKDKIIRTEYVQIIAFKKSLKHAKHFYLGLFKSNQHIDD